MVAGIPAKAKALKGGGERGGVRLLCGCLSVAHYMMSSCCADLTGMLAQPWQQQRQTAIFPASQLIQPVFFMLLGVSPFGRGKGGSSLDAPQHPPLTADRGACQALAAAPFLPVC